MTTLQANETSMTNEDKRFFLLVAMIFFAVIGVLMLIFAATFVRDLATLRTVPDALWNFLCGTPTDNQIALPLLLTVGIVCFGITGGLQFLRWRLPKRKSVD